MAALIGYVLRALALLGEILVIVQVIQGIVSTLATVTEINAMAADVKDIQLKVNDSVIGLAAIRGRVDDVYTLLDAFDGTAEGLLNDILAVVGTGGSGVPISNDTAQAIASAVWTFLIADRNEPAYQYLNQAGDYANSKGFAFEEIHSDGCPPFYVIGGTWGYDDQGLPDFSVPQVLDPSTILASDATPFDWVTRVYPDNDWLLGASQRPYLEPTGSGFFTFIVDLDPLKWYQLKSSLGLIVSSGASAPVWPGLANVTLGTPVTISLTFTVDGPMDGVIVALDTYPTLKGEYVYDDMTQALKIGALTFVDDNGDAEYIQSLGFLNEVYVPKNMAHAATCKVRTVSGVSGTVTPWTAN